MLMSLETNRFLTLDLKQGAITSLVQGRGRTAPTARAELGAGSKLEGGRSDTPSSRPGRDVLAGREIEHRAQASTP